MPTVNGLIGPDGALVNIEIGPSLSGAATLRSQMKPVPPPLDRIALINTGAETSAVDTNVAAYLRSLGVQIRAVTFTNAPALGGLGIAPILLVRIAVLHPSGQHLIEGDLPVQELPIGPLGYEALLGRDILHRCDFNYFGRSSRFELAY